MFVQFVLGPRAARAVQALTAAGPADGPPASESAAPGLAWVRVTGGAAPWWAGVVEVPLGDGTWQTLGACEVATPRGPLRSLPAARHLCTRTGDKADGTPRFVASPAVGTVVTCYADADNPGNTWTPGRVADTLEAVELQPRYGAGVTLGSITFPPHKLFNSLEYVCRDSGTLGTTGKRRLLAWPIGLIVCDNSDPNAPVLRVL